MASPQRADRRTPRLGAHARLARGGSGAGGRARAPPAARERSLAPRAPPRRRTVAAGHATRAHQDTNTRQAGAVHKADAPRRAATRRGAANFGASRRPGAGPPSSTRGAEHEGNHCHCT